MSKSINVRIPAPLAEALTTFCAAWCQPRSTVIRSALRFALHHPDFLLELNNHVACTVDTRTPEQQDAGERLLQACADFDIAAVVGAYTTPL